MCIKLIWFLNGSSIFFYYSPRHIYIMKMCNISSILSYNGFEQNYFHDLFTLKYYC